MIATFINCTAVVIGALLGFFLHSKISDSMKSIVYAGAGLVSLVIGIKMSLAGTRIVYLALSLIAGGILGNWLDIEGGILRFGSFLKRVSRAGDSETNFAYAYLNSSVIFCVGAMTLIGAFKAGAEANYELLLTKSVLDGFMAIVFAAALGIGVTFAALTILVYQGSLTLLARYLQPYATELVLSELTSVGGVLVIMIGINLLGLTKLKTANFLPAIVLILILLAVESLLPPGFLRL